MLPVPRIRRAPWSSDRAAGAADPEGCSTPRAGKLSAPGALGSAGCSDRAAGIEDPEGLQRTQGRRAARSRGSVGSTWCSYRAADVEAPGSCSASRIGELPAPGLLRSAWRSDRAAGAADPGSCSTPRVGLLFSLVFGDISPHLVK